MVTAIVLMLATPAKAMDFKTTGTTITATGAIVAGDAAKFQKAVDGLDAGGRFNELLLLLDSPGGLTSEAWRMSAIIRALPFRAVVAAGASCASSCAQILYISAFQHEVLHGGRLGFHSCRNIISGVADEACNKVMARNAAKYGTTTGVIMDAAHKAGTT